jgi:hypothetical protein
METLIVVLMGLAIAIIVLARTYYRDTKRATGVPVAPRRITSDDFEIVRRDD